MKKVKQLNNWTIKERTANDMYYKSDSNDNYVIFSPDGTCIEDRLSLEKAIEFCEENLDHVKKDNKLNKKTEFSLLVRKGMWFKVNKDTIVKVKSIGRNLMTLWLSKEYDTMCFTEFKSADWDIRNEKICTYTGHSFHFGEVTGEDDDIYNEEGILVEDKLESVILTASENNKYKLIAKEELNTMWSKLIKKEELSLKDIQFM